jgi:uncharacterized protein with HEPN domain
MSDRYLAHVVYILESIDLIEEFTVDGKDFLLKDAKTYHAVMRLLQTLSESTQKIPEDIKAQHPSVAWRHIKNFRNILVHEYLGEIDEERVWQVVVDDLPLLKASLRDIIPDWRERKNSTDSTV